MAPKKSSLAAGLETFRKDKKKLAIVETAPRSKREGLQMIGSHFDPQVRRTIMMIQAETGKNLHAVLTEAFNDLFSKYGKPKIAGVDE
jgi:hypothetical protein